jgi:hypothetical protein
MIPFGTRVKLAFSAFFSILFHGILREHVEAALVSRPAPEPPPPPPPPPPADPGHRATQLLAILQRDGRLVDFLMEDLAPYSDAQIGAAARDVHAGAGQALQRYFTLGPILDDEEGRPVTLPGPIDPARTKVVGHAAAQAPLRGTLRHRGWEATRVALPPLPSTGLDVVAPAEVEVS